MDKKDNTVNMNNNNNENNNNENNNNGLGTIKILLIVLIITTAASAGFGAFAMMKTASIGAQVDAIHTQLIPLNTWFQQDLDDQAAAEAEDGDGTADDELYIDENGNYIDADGNPVDENGDPIDITASEMAIDSDTTEDATIEDVTTDGEETSPAATE